MTIRKWELDMAEDHHAVLGIRADASRDEILRAYSELVKKCHPDHNRDDPDAEKKFIQIQRSFETLYEPERHQAAGVFHTRLSAFLRVWCLHDSIRRVPYSGDFRLPLIAMATVFYLFLLAAIFIMSSSPSVTAEVGMSGFSSATTESGLLGETWTSLGAPELGVRHFIIGMTLVYVLVVVAVVLKKAQR